MPNPKTFLAPRPFARHQPGEIVTARVANPLEDRATRGKARPVILIRREGPRWLVMGLTTRPQYANGLARTPVPNPMRCGLGARASFLWGPATWVCTLDIGDHVGRADDQLRMLIEDLRVERSLRATNAAKLGEPK